MESRAARPELTAGIWKYDCDYHVATWKVLRVSFRIDKAEHRLATLL